MLINFISLRFFWLIFHIFYKFSTTKAINLYLFVTKIKFVYILVFRLCKKKRSTTIWFAILVHFYVDFVWILNFTVSERCEDFTHLIDGCFERYNESYMAFFEWYNKGLNILSFLSSSLIDAIKIDVVDSALQIHWHFKWTISF